MKYNNPAYHGDLRRVFNNGETVITPDIYPKLRTRETYDQIQRLLKSLTSKKLAEPHFLRGVKINCADCGRTIGINKGRYYSKYESTYFALVHTDKNTIKKCNVKPFVQDKRIKRSLVAAVKDILTDQDTAKLYMDSDFDKDELKSLDTEIKRLEKQKQVIAEKIDRLLHLYLSGSWSQEQLDENKNILDTQLSNFDDVLKERKRKRELIESKQINYNTVADFLSVANMFDQLLDAKEQQELIGSLFPTATLDLKNATLILHAQLLQLVKIDINVRIETTEEVSARVLLDTAEKRYKEAQKYLNR